MLAPRSAPAKRSTWVTSTTPAPAVEFSRCFDRAFDRWVLRHMPFYTMNANHEMDSHGIPYFAFLKHKRPRGRAGTIHAQPQEGSYFCLSNDHYQIIALDTAYAENGRCRDAGMLDWLRDHLHRGPRTPPGKHPPDPEQPYGRPARARFFTTISRATP